MKIIPALSAALLVAVSAPARAYEPKPAERGLYLPTGREQTAAYRRALDLMERKDYRAAVAAFEEVLRLQPNLAVAMTYRAFALMELGELRSAIDGHDTVLALAPNRPNSWANSCWVRAVANTDLDQALALCDRAVQMGGGYTAYDARGLVRFKRGEFSAAIDDYTQAIRKDRKEPSGWFMRGVARLRAGDETGGRKDIAWAVKRDASIQDTYARWGVQP